MLSKDDYSNKTMPDNTGIAFRSCPCYNGSATKSFEHREGTIYVPPIGLSVLAFRSEKKVPAREGASLLAGGRRSTRYGTDKETLEMGLGGDCFGSNHNYCVGWMP
jgi:hypothetical protein